MKIISNKLITLLSIIGVIVITIVTYSKGLMGGYLLDDLPNLKNINVFSRFEGLDAFIRYVLSYESGTLKRPISTLSFLLNSTTISVNAFNFKVTNLIIHLLNGLLLYLVTHKLLSIQNFNTKNIQFIAIANMALWLLHPFFVSTTLYVVQRMAMLPVTFVLIGLHFYLKARTLPLVKHKLATFYFFIAIYLATLFAVLSKENGIILPFLILILESFIIKDYLSHQLSKLQKTIIVFPAIIIVIAFLLKIPDFMQDFEYRNFSMFERIITESRVLMSYLGHLVYPRFDSFGIFTDGFVISSSLFAPITTLISIFTIIAILYISFHFRKKHPFIGFAIFFYFVGHIIESTFIPLEIYFEHRNYLPALFLFLPIPLYLTKYLNTYNLHILIFIAISLFFAQITYKKSVLWGDTTKLMLRSADKNPQSVRAIESKVVYHYQNRNTQKAIDLLEKAIKNHPHTSLRLNLLNLKCLNNTATTHEFDAINKYIEKNTYTRHDAASMAGLINILTYEHCLENNHELASNLIKTIKKQNNFKIPKVRKAIISNEIYLAIAMDQSNLIDVTIIQYLYKYHDFYDVIKMIDKLIDIDKIEYAQIIIDIVESELSLKKYRYTDRDYLENIRLIKNKLI